MTQLLENILVASIQCNIPCNPVKPTLVAPIATSILLKNPEVAFGGAAMTSVPGPTGGLAAFLVPPHLSLPSAAALSTVTKSNFRVHEAMSNRALAGSLKVIVS